MTSRPLRRFAIYGKLSAIIVLIVTSSIVCGCSSGTHRKLKSIESYIQDRPDSALIAIQDLDTSHIGGKRNKALYSLLYTMALDKNYIDTTNLEVIRPALEHYSRRGPSSHKMASFFYQGRIYENRGEDDKALRYFLTALEDSSKVQDNRYKELTNSAIADVFSRSHNCELDLFYSNEALKYGKMDNDSIGVAAITGHLASCYANLMMWEEADATYKEYFALPVYDSSAYYRRKVLYAKDNMLKPDNDPQLSADILEDIAINYPWAMSVEAYCVYAYAQYKLGNESAANGIIEELESYGQQEDLVRLYRYRISKGQGRYENALEDLENSVLAQDSLLVEILKQSLSLYQLDYLRSETALLQKENKIGEYRAAGILLCSLIALGVISLFYSRRTKSLRNRLDELSSLYGESQRMLDILNAEAESVNSQLASTGNSLLSLRAQFASLYKAQYKALNDLCAAYLSPVKRDRKDLVYEEAMNQLGIIINDEDTQNRFMDIVDESLDNIIQKLREALPHRKEQDFRFFTYIIAGFDATTISSLTGYSLGSVYTKKARLRSEIMDLDSPYKQFFLEYIN